MTLSSSDRDRSSSAVPVVRRWYRADAARVVVLAIVLVAFVAAVYCPDLGRGFVKDDFTWIRTAQAAIAQPSTVILQRDAGFYRPIVTLTFVTDYALHEWDSRGYGWTNLALYILCVAAIVGLGLSIGLSRWAAALSAFLWAINPHGINMALLWLSGRAALLITLFSVVAGIAFVRRRYAMATVPIALALLSKEEAVALPAILLAWMWLRSRECGVPRIAIAAACVPLGVYLWMRSLTPAFTLATAPIFYQFTTDPWVLLRNVGEYLDRSGSLVAMAVTIAIVVYRVLPSFDGTDRQALRMMTVWWVGMFAVTMWLPVRSSLYAVCPSVGTAIIGAVILERLRVNAIAGRFVLEPVLAMLLLAAIPIYQARDRRRVEAARISARTIGTIHSDLAMLAHAGSVVFHDDPDASSFREAFGDLVSEALRVRFSRQWDARIENAQPRSEPLVQRELVAEYWIRRGRITRGSDRPLF